MAALSVSSNGKSPTIPVDTAQARPAGMIRKHRVRRSRRHVIDLPVCLRLVAESYYLLRESFLFDGEEAHVPQSNTFEGNSSSVSNKSNYDSKGGRDSSRIYAYAGSPTGGVSRQQNLRN